MNNYRPQNEDGFVLVICLVMLVVLSLMGIVGTRTTSIELAISGNDKVNKQTFFQADGATEVGIELVELNISCPTGFTKAGAGFNSNDPASASSYSIHGVDIFDANFALDEGMNDIANDAGVVGATVEIGEMPSPSARTLSIQANKLNLNSGAITNLAIFGDTVLSTGSAVQLAQGYEGKGKGAAGGGAYIAYQIHAQHQGVTNSESIVRLDWDHLIGTEGDTCQY